MTTPEAPQAHTGALSHLRILDLSRVLAGPWATQNLADMGAEVIKIERPGMGDDTRGWGPPYIKDPAGHELDASYFISANRGKQSVTLDIATKEGQAIVRKLAESCDVFLENYKVGTMAKYGLSYDDLKAINPRLIYVSVTGFGQSGPYAHLPGYDFIFQGMGGLMSITGFPETPDGQSGPVKSGLAMVDLMTGMYTTVAILGAVEHRHKTGLGQYIDMALLDCVVAMTSYQAMNWFYSGKVPGLMGNGHPNMVPYQAFRCKDGLQVILAIGNDSQFASFCRAIDRMDIGEDPRFKVVSGRVRNRELIVGIVAEIMRTRDRQEWIDLLNQVNVPVGPINNIKQVFEDPQVQHRGLKISMRHSSGTDTPLVASPLRLSETPVVYERAAPMLGEHTSAVLQRLAGMSPEEIDALHKKGVIG